MVMFYPSYSHTYLAGHKPIARKISIAIVLLIVVDHLRHGLEGGDVGVGGRVNDVDLW